MASDTNNLPSLATIFHFLEESEGDSHLEKSIGSKKLTRDAFFDKASWAILVSNTSAFVAGIWGKKAHSTGFPDDWETLANWGDQEFDSWCKKMAAVLESPRSDLVGMFRDRWWSIWDLACWIDEFLDDDDFCNKVFGGKRKGKHLNDDDVQRLIAIKKTGWLRMIGHANRYFILRNLGGDFLKPDVWVNAFCEWYGDLTVGELARKLRHEGIHCGRFDAYLWNYCSREVQDSKRLGVWFDELALGDGDLSTYASRESISVRDFEEAIWNLEGIRLLVRAPKDTRLLNAYGFERSANRDWTLNKWIQTRVEPIMWDFEVTIVDGRGAIPRANSRLQTVRDSYDY